MPTEPKPLQSEALIAEAETLLIGTTPDWEFVQHPTGGIWLGNIIGNYGGGSIRTIACICKHGPDVESMANAKFAARARAIVPDLVAEMKRMREIACIHEKLVTAYGRLSSAQARMNDAKDLEDTADEVDDHDMVEREQELSEAHSAMTQEFLDALKLNGMVAASLRAGVEKGEGGE